MLNVKKLFTKILVNISNLNSTAIVGVTTNYTTISVTNDTVFTCSSTGWLVCTLTTNSGQTVAPYVAIELYNSSGTQIGVIASSWGITTNGATLSVQAPVQNGQKYRVHAVRCSIGAARIYH